MPDADGGRGRTAFVLMEPDSGAGAAAAVSGGKALLLSSHIPHKEWTITEEGGGGKSFSG